MKNFDSRFLAGIALALGGCTLNYSPPTSGSLATLRISTTFKEGTNMPVRRYVNPDCSDYPGELVGWLRSTRDGQNASDELTTTARGGEKITLSIQSVLIVSGSLTSDGAVRAMAHVCQPVIEFIPAAGEQYDVVSAVTPSTCTIRVFRVSATDGKRIVEPTARQSPLCHSDRYP